MNDTELEILREAERRIESLKLAMTSAWLALRNEQPDKAAEFIRAELAKDLP